MQLGNLQFRNMDEVLKNKVVQKTEKIFEHLKNNFVITGSFERTALGKFTGVINGKSGNGEFHAHAKNGSLDQLLTVLKKKIRAQVEEGKNRDKALRHDRTVATDQLLNSIAIEMHCKPVPKVLIIDDDMEAIIPIEMIFRDMGCLTSFAIDRDEAMNKLKHMPADIIILDWMLDRTTGGELIRNISLEGEAFTIENGYRPKVITYSGLVDTQISFPQSRWFEHVKHWNKPINYDQISAEAEVLLYEMGFLTGS